jgi:hypothetical protein
MDVTSVLSELLAHNRGLDPLNPDHRQPSNYGVTASLEDAVLHVVLTLRAGATYCCYEPGCHLPLHRGKRWDVLREALVAHGIDAPSRLTLRLTVVVEEGARFFDLSKPDQSRRGWYAFKPVEAYRYQISKMEGGTTDA